MKLEFDATSRVEVEMVRKMFTDVAFDLETPRSLGEVDERVEVPVIPEPKTIAEVILADKTIAEVILADKTIAEVAAEVAATAAVIPNPPITPAEQAAGMPEDDVDPDATPAPDRDKHGRIWDERIDSSNHKQTTGGEWNKRRNVDDAVRQQVMAELASADTAAPADVFTPPVAPPAPVDVNAPPPPPVEIGAAEAPSIIDWGVVFTRTMDAKTKELVTQEQIDTKVAEYGIVGGFPALIARPDLYEQFLIELSIA